MQLSRKSRAMFISLIKKHPRGIENRLQHFDKWVLGWNTPPINSYYDHYRNGEAGEHEMWVPDCPKSRIALDLVEFNHRPALAQMHKRTLPISDHFADDSDLSQDLSKVTLKSFLKGVGRQETRTDLQRLFLWGSLGIVSFVAYLYSFVWVDDDEQKIVQLQPHPSYFHYHFSDIREYVKMCVEKINFLERHSREELGKARARAL